MLRKFSILIAVLATLTMLAVTGRAQADATPTPDHMLMEMNGTPMPAEEHDHASRIPANGAAVKIVAPADGAQLDQPTAIVRVETTNWPLGESERHWHLYVNGKEQGMSQGNSPALPARDLQPGDNVIEAVLSNQLHQELDATARITVHYAAAPAAEAAAPVASPGLSAGVVITLTLIVLSVAAILAIGFAITRKKSE